MQKTSKYRCKICGYVYDEAQGDEKHGIKPNTAWEQLPENFVCPVCGAVKSDFEKIEEITAAKTVTPEEGIAYSDGDVPDLILGALCSNLAKGCEKQYRFEEAKLFNELADYYTAKMPSFGEKSLSALNGDINNDAVTLFPSARAISSKVKDRGALRVLTWAEKATAALKSVLQRYAVQGDAVLKDTKIYVCEICGFVYIGNEPLEVCPVCKVPKLKIHEIRG